MIIQTDSLENTATAKKLYEKRGYVLGLDIEDYFGPGRNLFTYYADISKENQLLPLETREEISSENRKEIEDLARKVYEPEKFEEFLACLDLLLRQEKGKQAILTPHSFVLRDKDKKIQSFSILTSGVYDNALFSSWFLVDPDDSEASKNLMVAIKRLAKAEDKEIIVLDHEHEDSNLSQYGFLLGAEGVPGVYGKGDKVKYLLYSKKLKILNKN